MGSWQLCASASRVAQASRLTWYHVHDNVQRVHLALLREGERVRHHLRALSQTTEGRATTEALPTTAGYVERESVGRQGRTGL